MKPAAEGSGRRSKKGRRRWWCLMATQFYCLASKIYLHLWICNISRMLFSCLSLSSFILLLFFVPPPWWLLKETSAQDPWSSVSISLPSLFFCYYFNEICWEQRHSFQIWLHRKETLLTPKQCTFTPNSPSNLISCLIILRSSVHVLILAEECFF